MTPVRHALVVGGAGFVGQACVDALLTRGWRVSVLDPRPAAANAGADHVAGTLEDSEALGVLLRRMQPDGIVNLAAHGGGTGGLARSAETDPERAIAVNVLGFRRLLAAAAQAGIGRVVWTSSTVVFGAAGSPARVDEDAARCPMGLYALTKVMAEEIAAFMRRRLALEVVGLRIPLILGAGLWYDGAAAWVKQLVAQALPGNAPEIIAPEGRFDAMHVADVGRLIAALLDGPAPASAIYNVAGFTTDAVELATMLGTLVAGYAPRLRTAPPAIRVPLMDETRLRRDTGFAILHDALSVLRDMLAEHRRHRVG